jgi:hypothetical protein
MKNATATSHGKSCLLEAGGGREEALIRCVPKLVVCYFYSRYLYPTDNLRGEAAANANLVSTISLKRNTPFLQLSTSGPADYPILLGLLWITCGA